MASIMRAPADTKTFFVMAQELNLGVHVTSRYARMLCPIPNHDTPIRTHRCDYVRILWLISGFVNLTLMVDPLNDVKFYFHSRCFLGGSAAISTYFLSIFVVVACIWSHRIRKCDGCDLEVIGCITIGMSAYE